jgi:ribosomal protein S18 acetylase RimI-like enzyme
MHGIWLKPIDPSDSDDLDFTWQLRLENDHHFFKPLGTFDEHKKYINSVGFSSSIDFFIIMMDTTKVGTISLKGSTVIGNVIIAKSYRGKSYGRTAMELLERIARTRSIKSHTLQLEVQANNEGALNFYRKLGYKISAEVLTMTKALP